jgi:hypothetical protein
MVGGACAQVNAETLAFPLCCCATRYRPYLLDPPPPHLYVQPSGLVPDFRSLSCTVIIQQEYPCIDDRFSLKIEAIVLG